jgi:predicted dehydrogenase
MINAAVVGLGRWGQNLVNSVQGKSDRLRFVRGVVRHPEAVQDFATKQGFQLSSTLEAALQDPQVQAVVLATPHKTHVEQIIAAARAGKAVFCEKPLALNAADARRAVEACRKAGVLLGVGQDKRFWSSMQELKRVVASGQLGTILHVEGNSSNEVSKRHYSPWRTEPGESPGGSMTATGIHILDAFVNLVGPVSRVQSQMIIRQRQPDLLDTVSVVYEFENQASGILSSVRATPLFWRVHVFGTAGSAEASGENEIIIRMSGEKPQRRVLEPTDALRFELELFCDGVTGKSPYPITGEQIVDVVTAFEATARSLDTGEPQLVTREPVTS